ncbi:hypothetical protein [Variovorax sp. E3]|uniref:hypothetical protein n=1 Tax=Variovorax sp. E3 TaxID=1914993 RepID=UPI0018DC0B16|nr:hypothetical protein [Variovorax sp. E3]
MFVDSDGSRSTRGTSLETELEFDQWNESACEHESGVYVRRPIGNVSLVGMLREQLNTNEMGEDFPILLGHVLYNGTHGGDSVSMELMPQLREEVSKLFKVRCNEPRTEAFLRGFEKTMQALCIDVETLDRPICF